MKPRYSGFFVAALVAILITPGTYAYHSLAGGPIIVNGQELAAEQGQALMQLYGQIPAGNYWYDTYSGLWGTIGGPGTGRILPGLNLGGPLQAGVSGGGTGVFVNGRELHPLEVRRLVQIYGSVTPGRYWMNAQLIGGFEGGPATFDLNAAAASAGAEYGQGSGYNRNTIGGGLMSDGGCSGYLHPSGASVMTGNY